MKSEGFAGLYLRIGLAFAFLYFGIDKFASPGMNEATFENLWTVNLIPLPVASQVILSGIVELAIGIFLLLGVFNQAVSLAAATWTFLIFMSLGLQAGTYDIVLTFSAIALYFTGPGKMSLKLNYLNQD